MLKFKEYALFEPGSDLAFDFIVAFDISQAVKKAEELGFENYTVREGLEGFCLKKSEIGDANYKYPHYHRLN